MFYPKRTFLCSVCFGGILQRSKTLSLSADLRTGSHHVAWKWLLCYHFFFACFKKKLDMEPFVKVYYGLWSFRQGLVGPTPNTRE